MIEETTVLCTHKCSNIHKFIITHPAEIISHISALQTANGSTVFPDMDTDLIYYFIHYYFIIHYVRIKLISRNKLQIHSHRSTFYNNSVKA